MKTLLACALVFAPTTVMAQVSQGPASAEALTAALNTNPPAAISATPVAAPQVPAARGGAPASIQAPSEAEALTRSLNQAQPGQAVRPNAPPVVDRPAETKSPEAQPSRTVTDAPVAEVRPRPVAQPTPRAAPAPASTAPEPVRSVTPRPTPATQSAPPSRSAPASVTTPKPAETPRPVVTTPAAPPASSPARSERAVSPTAPVPGVLNAAAIAELPFQIDLPAGVQLASVSTAQNARVWSVRKGPKVLAMIFAGAQSQFPIFEGEQRTVAGRTSVVLDEGTKRVAVEHLFQRAEAPQELHIWLMVSEGADRDLAERIAQTLDYR